MKTTKAVLEECRIEGIKMSERTFDFYGSREMGLLPRPSKKVHGEGGRGVYNVYEDNIIDRIKEIYLLKKKGLTLKQISFKFQKREELEIEKNLKNVRADKYRMMIEYLLFQRPYPHREKLLTTIFFNDAEDKIYNKLKELI